MEFDLNVTRKSQIYTESNTDTAKFTGSNVDIANIVWDTALILMGHDTDIAQIVLDATLALQSLFSMQH